VSSQDTDQTSISCSQVRCVAIRANLLGGCLVMKNMRMAENSEL